MIITISFTVKVINIYYHYYSYYCFYYWDYWQLYCYHSFFYNYIASLQVFHTSINWWSLDGVWVTSFLLRSPWLFPLNRAILTMMLFQMVSTRPLISNASLPSLWELFQVLQLQLVSLSPPCSIALARSQYLFLFSLSSIFIQWTAKMTKSTIWQVLFFWVGGNYHSVWSFGEV